VLVFKLSFFRPSVLEPVRFNTEAIGVLVVLAKILSRADSVLTTWGGIKRREKEKTLNHDLYADLKMSICASI